MVSETRGNQSLQTRTSARKLTGVEMSLGEIRRWVQSHLQDVRHERRVLRIATVLFDLTTDLHQMGKAERRLLRAGAMLHDVGRCHGAKRHHIRGAKMVLESETLRLTHTSRESLAYMVHHHRGPAPMRRKETAVLPGHDFSKMRLLLAILRCADSFDSRRLPTPTLMIRRSGRSLRIRCYVECDPRAARGVFDRRKKYGLLEDLLELPVRVEVRNARPSR